MALDWQNFNLLENLLVHCSEPSLRAPAESGVQFRLEDVGANTGKSLTLLYKIDRQPDPLIREGVKPDYLALHIANGECIATIIEMKGKDEKKQRHGLDQILTFHELAKRELAQHIPGSCRNRIHWQAILLAPQGANVPQQAIVEANKTLPIVPLLDQSAELGRYISKKLGPTERYRRPTQRTPNPATAEAVLTSGLMSARQNDRFKQSHFSAAGDREGIYLNIKTENGYLAVAASRKTVCVGYSSPAAQADLDAVLQPVGGLCSGATLSAI